MTYLGLLKLHQIVYATGASEVVIYNRGLSFEFLAEHFKVKKAPIALKIYEIGECRNA